MPQTEGTTADRQTVQGLVFDLEDAVADVAVEQRAGHPIATLYDRVVEARRRLFRAIAGGG